MQDGRKEIDRIHRVIDIPFQPAKVLLFDILDMSAAGIANVRAGDLASSDDVFGILRDRIKDLG